MSNIGDWFLWARASNPQVKKNIKDGHGFQLRGEGPVNNLHVGGWDNWRFMTQPNSVGEIFTNESSDLELHYRKTVE